MTIEILEQYRALQKEITRDQERLRELSYIYLPCGLRTGQRGNEISDLTGCKASEIADVRESFERNIARCWFQLSRITRFIEKIEDSYLREVFKLRFIDGLTWLQIASRLGTSGDGSTERKCILRYLEKKQHIA